MKVAFIGAGTHVLSVLDSLNNEYEVVGVYDNLLQEDTFYGIKKLGGLRDFVNQRELYDAIMITLGDITMRENLLSLVQENAIPMFSVIDESAIVSTTATIAEGTFVGKCAVVNAYATIGEACILNTGCVVEHGCELGKNVHVAPNATLCGNVYVEDHVLLGAASCVIQSLKICSHAFVGASACVCKNIDRAGIYVGVPARMVK